MFFTVDFFLDQESEFQVGKGRVLLVGSVVVMEGGSQRVQVVLNLVLFFEVNQLYFWVLRVFCKEDY